MTIRDKELIASSPTEAEIMNSVNGYGINTERTVEAVPVMDPYGTGSNINVPFASAVTTIELEQLSSAYGSSTTTTTAGTEPKPRAIVSPTTYIATRAPIIRAALTQSAPTVPPTQRHIGNQHARRNNNQGCCNNRTCCCVTLWILSALFLLCILPFIIIFIVALIQF
jgi:hypothetical protein